MARGAAPIHQLEDMRTPINDVLKIFAEQMAELQRYKARYGELDEDSDDLVEETEDSDTEQE